MNDALAATRLVLDAPDPAPVLVLLDDPGLRSIPSAGLTRRARTVLGVTLAAAVIATGAGAGWLYMQAEARTAIHAAGYEPATDGLLEALASGNTGILPQFRTLGLRVATTPRSIEAAVRSGSAAVLAQVIAEGARLENEPSAAQLLPLAVRSDDAALLEAVLKLRPLDPGTVPATFRALMQQENGTALRRLAREPLLRSYRDADGDGLAHLAARLNAAELWRELLASGPPLDVRTPNARGDTPLHVAAWAGQAASVRALLEAGLDAAQPNGKGQTALDLAYANQKDDALATIAAMNEPAARLLASNFDALFDKGLRATMASLITRRIPLDEPTQKGLTPLAMAASAGDIALVSLLLDNGANVNAPSTVSGVSGVTALMLAAVQGRDDVARNLLEHGADPGKAASNGATAAGLAARNGHTAILPLLQR